VFTVFSKKNKKIYEKMEQLPLEEDKHVMKEDDK